MDPRERVVDLRVARVAKKFGVAAAEQVVEHHLARERVEERIRRLRLHDRGEAFRQRDGLVVPASARSPRTGTAAARRGRRRGYFLVMYSSLMIFGAISSVICSTLFACP